MVWVVSVTAGGLGGILIPDRVVGLEFAMTALFLVLGVEATRPVGTCPHRWPRSAA